MMSKKNIKKDFLAYEKLLYIKFANPISEDEILKKSFEELGLKDDFSYKLAYFYNKHQTYVFLTKYENILDYNDYNTLIPEPLLFEAYFNQDIDKNLILIFKDKYIVLIEYLGQQFLNCKTLPINIYNINYEQKIKSDYRNIISINDVKNISSFKKIDSEKLYYDLLNSNTDFSINFASKEKKLFYKSLSFKIICSFVFGILLALIYPLYLHIHNLTIEKKIENYEKVLIEEKNTLEYSIQKQNIIDIQNKNKEKNQLLYEFYKNTLCYKDFYNFIKVLNVHKSTIESLYFKENIFNIELTRDYNFYNDFKKYGFILKNKEINNEKINLYFEKNI
ncbi:hypothetical protein CAQ16704_0781 [Campylobacter sp. RM16704]|nr:hypothetical protein CAQ16704_0781 [Campylobacter sp. RM16704]